LVPTSRRAAGFVVDVHPAHAETSRIQTQPGNDGDGNIRRRRKDTTMLFASAVPLRPGKTDRYRDLATELRPHLEEYQHLNRRFEVKGHAYWINHGRETDFGVSAYDISPAGLGRMRLREWDPSSAYDRWWLEFVEDVNGLDLLQGPAHVAPPEPVFDWSDE
jgi:hypothetical protein